MSNTDGNVKTPEGRASYAFVLKTNPDAKTQKGQEKYTLSLLVPKDSDLSKMRAAAKACAVQAFGEMKKGKVKFSGKMKTVKMPFKDGDAEDNESPEQSGMTIIEMSSLRKPGIVDRDGTTYLTEPSDFYSGCWCIVQCRPFTWEYKGKIGVSFGLTNIQKTKNDTQFGGGPAAHDSFEALDAEDDAEDDDFYDDDDDGDDS